MTDIRTISECVILARGLGTRMREDDANVRLDEAQSACADIGLKAMVPVGRPFLDYVLSALADAGFDQACLVIGPEHSIVANYYSGARKPSRIHVSFAPQSAPRGTADAVLAAEAFVGSDEFAVINSDNYYPVEALRELRNLGHAGTVLFEALALLRHSNIPPDRIQTSAHCVLNRDGDLADIVEKPNSGPTANFDNRKLISMNCWRFGPDIFQTCRNLPLSLRGEYELPLAVKLGIAHGIKFKVTICRAGVLDLSRRSDISTVADRLKDLRVQL